MEVHAQQVRVTDVRPEGAKLDAPGSVLDGQAVFEAEARADGARHPMAVSRVAGGDEGVSRSTDCRVGVGGDRVDVVVESRQHLDDALSSLEQSVPIQIEIEVDPLPRGRGRCVALEVDVEEPPGVRPGEARQVEIRIGDHAIQVAGLQARERGTLAVARGVARVREDFRPIREVAIDHDGS